MKRRTALRNIGVGLSAGMTLPAWLSACSPVEPGPEIQYDGVVAIIGAGAAGLYVADILQAKGIKVMLFEASDRLGGRIRSIRQFEDHPLSNSYPIELGAERILGSDSLWAKMVKQLERPFVEFPPPETPLSEFPPLATDRFFVDGAFKTKADIETDPDFVAAFNFFNTLKNYSGSNVSVQQAIEAAGLGTRVHSILNSMIGNKYGTSNARLGVTALAQGLNLITRNAREWRLGTNPMQDVLSSRFSAAASQVQFDHVVKSVNYSGEKVFIQGERKISDSSTESFSIEADKVIITVPVSILKDGDIEFTPALPSAKNTALSRMEMDAAIRVVLEFKVNFWGPESTFVYGGTDIPEYFNVGVGETNVAYSRMLSMTVTGPRAEELSPLGNDIVPVILEELDTYFDGKASLNIRKEIEAPNKILSIIHDWTTEPFVRGGAAYVKPGGTNADRITLGQPVGTKLFFAGEATDGTGEFGTINGALLSGERVAQEVIDSILA